MNMRRLPCALTTVLIAFTLVVTPAVTQVGHNPFQDPATPVAEPGVPWQVAERKDLPIDGDLITMSPDGLWVAGLGPDSQFCVWDLQTLAGNCVDGTGAIDPLSITWAPDGSAVAFSLMALLYLMDSDIYVYDVAGGNVSNLTDDGFEGSLPYGQDDAPNFPVDIYPAWTPDSQSLVFARTGLQFDLEDDEEAIAQDTNLMVVSRAGSDPELLASASTSWPWAVSSPMFVLTDGSVVYTLSIEESDDPDNGIWLLDTGGMSSQLVAGNVDAEFPHPFVVDVFEGETGTMLSGNTDLGSGHGMAFVVDLATGTVIPADGGEGNRTRSRSFGPDGSLIGAVLIGEETHLMTTNPDGATSDLGTFAIEDVGRYVFDRGLDWNAANTVLLPGFQGGGILLTVVHSG
jgi:WD40 repeat protein